MKEGPKINKLEKFVINSCTPLEYMLRLGYQSPCEIKERKTRDYRRLVNYLDNQGEIPHNVRMQYQRSICGILALKTAYLRNKLQNEKDEFEDNFD